MVERAIVIILLLLILANITISVVNRMTAKCNPAKDYFQAAKKLPDGQLASLGSVQSGINTNYIGFKTVETGQPGVIGITSRNLPNEKSVDYDSFTNKIPSYIVTSDEDLEMLKDHTISTQYDKSIVESIKKMYPGSNHQVEERKREVKKYGDNPNGAKLAMFEVEMEGISAENGTKRQGNVSRPSEMGMLSERDGYS